MVVLRIVRSEISLIEGPMYKRGALQEVYY